jgi:hypothetical protein
MQTYRLLVAAAFCCFVAPALAAPISVSGGFSSFDSTIYEGVGINYFLGPPGGSSPNTVQICPGGAGGNCTQDPNDAAALDAKFNFTVIQPTFTFFDTSPFVNTANSFSFTPAIGQSVAGRGVQFLLGTLTITNGDWVSDASLGFTLTSHSTDPQLNDQTFAGVLQMNLDAGPGGSDIFKFLPGPGVGPGVMAVTVDDLPANNVGSMNVYGEINSLDLTKVDDFTGGLRAVTPLPEPSTIALVAAGLGIMALLRLTRRRPGMGSACGGY